MGMALEDFVSLSDRKLKGHGSRCIDIHWTKGVRLDQDPDTAEKLEEEQAEEAMNQEAEGHDHQVAEKSSSQAGWGSSSSGG